MQTETTAATSANRNACFHCGGEIIWSGDFSFSDYGMDGEGVIHELHCKDCGAEIVYYCAEGDEDETDA